MNNFIYFSKYLFIMKRSIIFKLFVGFIIIGCFFSCNQNSHYKTYYFSNTGNNNNSGLSKNSPWKDINKLDAIALNPGDKILFHRGDTFTGNINLGQSGTKQNPITIASYGEGEMPVLKGSITVKETFKSEHDSLILFHSISKIKNVYVNNKLLIPARYPNSGYLRIDESEDRFGILKDYDLKNEDHYWNGARIVFRSTHFSYDWEIINEYINNTFYFDTLDIKYPVKKNYGYFLDQKAELLDTAGEFYYDHINKVCKFYPRNKKISSIEGTIYDHGIYLADSVNNIVIQNLHFIKYHKAGVYGESNNSNINILNCTFAHIEKAGLQFRINARFCNIIGNHFNNIMGRGISFSNSSNNIIKKNRVQVVGLIPGLGIHSINGMSGIIVEAKDETRNNALDISTFRSDSNYIGLNRVDSCGYIGIRVDGKNNMIEKNIISNALLKLNFGSAIYCYKYTSNCTIQNNYVYNTIGNIQSTSKKYQLNGTGITITKASDCKILNNTIFNNITGISLTAKSKNCQCIGNIMYENSKSQFTMNAHNVPFNENHDIKHNTFFCTKPQQWCMIQQFHSIDTVFGTFDYNAYCNPFSDYTIKRDWRIQDSLTLKKWQHFSGEDKHSTNCEFYHPTNFNHKLFYNKSNKDIDIQLNKVYYDLNGNKYSHLQLKPYTSKILIYKKN